MNIVDGACSKCGKPTTYDGRLPILCKACWEAERAEEARRWRYKTFPDYDVHAEREKLEAWLNNISENRVAQRKEDAQTIVKILNDAGLETIVVSGEDICVVNEVEDYAKAKGCKVITYSHDNSEEGSNR